MATPKHPEQNDNRPHSKVDAISTDIISNSEVAIPRQKNKSVEADDCINGEKRRLFLNNNLRLDNFNTRLSNKDILSSNSAWYGRSLYLTGILLITLISLSVMATMTPFVTYSHAKAGKSGSRYTAKINSYQTLKWEDLLPKSDLQALQAGPTSFLIPEGDIRDRITSQLSMKLSKPKDAYERALVSVGVQSKLNNTKVKIPGFIVPVDIQGEGVTKSFFFVPYFGQCLHLPPPPPNQIIFAQIPKGYKITDLAQPYYIKGTLYTEQSQNDSVKSAYTAKVDKIYPYLSEKNK